MEYPRSVSVQRPHVAGDDSRTCCRQDLNAATLSSIRDIFASIARELEVNGPFNMQLIAKVSDLGTFGQAFPDLGVGTGAFIQYPTLRFITCEYWCLSWLAYNGSIIF